jgi:hypothetical protein
MARTMAPTISLVPNVSAAPSSAPTYMSCLQGSIFLNETQTTSLLTHVQSNANISCQAVHWFLNYTNNYRCILQLSLRPLRITR